MALRSGLCGDGREEILIADYDLLKSCGRGAYGEVWVARSRSGQLVALKLLFDTARMEKELAGLRCYSRLADSPQLIRVLHTGEYSGGLYYTMELADNLGPDMDQYVPATLANILKRQGRLPVPEIRRVGQAILGGLEVLKQAGLVHRDVKPENVLFVQGVPKLSDIGLIHSVSRTGSVGGTLGFIPPERLRAGMAGNDHADDLYACGKVLYCCLTGNSADDFPALPRDVLGDAGSRQVNQVVLTACGHRRRQRFLTTAEFSRALVVGVSPGKRLAAVCYRLRYALLGAVLLSGVLLGVVLRPAASKGVVPDVQVGAIRDVKQLDVIAYGDGMMYLPEPGDALHEGIVPFELDGAPRRKTLVFTDPRMAKDNWSDRDGTGFIFWRDALYVGSLGVLRLQQTLPMAYALSFDIDCSGMNGAVGFEVASLDHNELARTLYHWTLYRKRTGELAVSPLAFRAEDGREYSFQPLGFGEGESATLHVDMVQTERIFRVYLNGVPVIYVPSLFFGGQFGIATDEKRSGGDVPITNLQIHAIERDPTCPANEQYVLPIRPKKPPKQAPARPVMAVTPERLRFLAKSFTLQAMVQIFAADEDRVLEVLEENDIQPAVIRYGSRTRQPRSFLNEHELADLRRQLLAIPVEDAGGDSVSGDVDERSKPSVVETNVH